MQKTYKILNKNHMEEALREFVKSIPLNHKNKILIKPNFVSLEGYPYTTDFLVIDTIIKLLYEGGARDITVADSPCPDQCMVFEKEYIDMKTKAEDVRNFHRRLRNTATFEEEIEEYNKVKQYIEKYIDFFFNRINKIYSFPFGYKAENLFSTRFNLPLTTSLLNNGYSIKYFDLAAYDLIINLPVLKLHTTVGFTGAVKNFYGILEPQSKVFLHKYKIVGNALKVLCSYLSSLNIYTFLDARIVPDAQQLLWGNSNTWSLNRIIYGDNLRDIDLAAILLLETEGILKECKDKEYYDFISES